MDKKDFIGVEKVIDATSPGMEETKSPELQQLINRFELLIEHLEFDIVSIEGALNRIDADLLEPSDKIVESEQVGILGTFRQLLDILEYKVYKVAKIKKALQKLA